MFKSKKSKLILGIIFDLIGMASYLIPGIGELTDAAWAPMVLWLMTKMYPGNTGVASGIFGAVEELIPGLDIIPTFTLTWVYTYMIRKESDKEKPTVIDVQAD